MHFASFSFSRLLLMCVFSLLVFANFSTYFMAFNASLFVRNNAFFIHHPAFWCI